MIRTGLIFRNERHVPYARIQNVDGVQTVFHRLLKVVDVKVQTAGGNEPEATMSVLPVAAFDQMRLRVIDGRRQAELALTADAAPASEVPPAPAPTLLLALAPKDLLTYGFVEGRGMVVVAAIFGLVWEFGMADSFMPSFPDFIDERVLNDEKTLPRRSGRGIFRTLAQAIYTRAEHLFASALVAALAILALLVLVRLVSMLWATIRLHGFRLTREGEDLRTEYGLLTRVAATIPLRRIQTLTLREGPLHRLVGRISARVDTAGGEAGTNAPPDRHWLAPIVERRRAAGPAGAGDAGALDGPARLAAGASGRQAAPAEAIAGVLAVRVSPAGRNARLEGAGGAGGADPVVVRQRSSVRGGPGLGGHRRTGRVSQRLVLAADDGGPVCARAGGDNARVPVRSAEQDGRRPGGHGRRRRPLAPRRDPLPGTRGRGAALAAGRPRGGRALLQVVMTRNALLISVVALAGVGALLAGPLRPNRENDLPTTSTPPAATRATPVYQHRVVRTFPHDRKAFTQGLVYRDGVFYESTGLYGESSVRKVAIETGEVLRKQAVDAKYFAEGLSEWGETLVQLTWTTGVAFVYDRETFKQVGRFEYTGEGWGLTRTRSPPGDEQRHARR